MAGSKFIAGPKMPPPRIIFSGLNKLTRLAIAIPQYSIHDSIIVRAIVSLFS
jgi:hypothetical protein